MTSKRQPQPKHTVVYQVANLDEAFDRMRSQFSEAHLIYALVNEETRQCYVGYCLGKRTIEAKKCQLESKTGRKFTTRVLAAEAYANEHEMRTKKLLCTSKGGRWSTSAFLARHWIRKPCSSASLSFIT